LKLDNALKLAAAARQNADSLKKELDQLKKKLKEEEKERVESEAQRKEKEGLLRQSILALLGNFQCLILEPFFLNFIMF
jgi:CHASE3 domain sensor protein